MTKFAVITVSDKGSAGEREDRSGPEIVSILEEQGFQCAVREIVPDEQDLIAGRQRHLADTAAVDLILTTGGTGLAPRDVTPEATQAVIDREAPGFAEAMRSEGLRVTPHAMLSRAVCGIRRRTLIINLPGSVKAVREGLAVILPALPHAMEILSGAGGECGE